MRIRQIIGLSILSMLPLISACTIMSVVSAIPSSVVDSTVYVFSGEKVSLPLSVESTLVAIQRSLHSMDLGMNLVEKTSSGYVMDFGNKDLTGKMELKRETDMLSTLYIKIRKGMIRQESIEMAVINVLHEKVKTVAPDATPDLTKYLPIRKRPDLKQAIIGWYCQKSLATMTSSSKKGWLRISMPSGSKAYIRGVMEKKP